MRQGLMFSFFPFQIELIQYHLLKDFHFLIDMTVTFVKKSIDHVCVGLFPALYYVSVISMFIFCQYQIVFIAVAYTKSWNQAG